MNDKDVRLNIKNGKIRHATTVLLIAGGLILKPVPQDQDIGPQNTNTNKNAMNDRDTSP